MRLNYALYYAQELSCILIMVSITVMNYAYFYVFIIILMIFFVIYFLIEESLWLCGKKIEIFMSGSKKFKNGSNYQGEIWSARGADTTFLSPWI